MERRFAKLGQRAGARPIKLTQLLIYLITDYIELHFPEAWLSVS